MSQQEDIQKKLKKKRSRELLAYFRQMVGKEGIGATLRRTARYLKRRYGGKKGRFLPTKKTLAAQRAANTAGWPLISVCVPVYNPNQDFFAALLASVKAQTYPNWQLCLADAGDDPVPVQAMVEQAADDRICLVKVENQGISANTSRAAQLATGAYIALLDHDDLLAPHALYELAKAAMETGADFLYSDEALFTKDMLHPAAGHFKPDYAHQYLLNVNYIAHLAMLRRSLFEELGGLRPAFDGSQDHDLYLRAVERTGGAVHVPKVLYYWRQHAGSTSTGTAAKPYVRQAAVRAIEEHLARTGRKGTVKDGMFPSTYKVDYEIVGRPLVSIVIPSYEHVPELAKCLHSVYTNTGYDNFEVVVVENNSKQPATFAFYKEIQHKYPRCRVVTCKGDGSFNFSAVCNYGRRQSKGEHLLFLNNDTEAINREWLGEMLQLSQLPEAGAVGAMLYYPDDTVQHAGVIVGLGGYGGHSHKYARRGRSGYMFRQACVQELSAVTAACLMMPARVFDELGGFDEGFTVAYNDVDLCLRVRKAGYSVLFTPYAELHHYESKSRGSDEKGPARERFAAEQARLRERWGQALLQDPFYNPNLTMDREDFSESDILPQE